MRIFWLFTVLMAIALVSGCSKDKTVAIDPEIAKKDKQISSLSAELENYKRSAAQEKMRLDSDLKKALADLENEKKLRVAGNRIILPNAVLFASGSNQLNDEGKRVLAELSKTLAKYSDREVLIEGHTDNVPIATKYQGKYKSNWELSSARAITVLRYLQSQPSTKSARLAAVAYGETRPVADNAMEETRMKNRRVVVVIGPKA